MANTETLKQALAAYTGESESLNQFVAVATQELGDGWAEVIYDTLTDLSAEEKDKLDHAFQYYAATTAWNEAQTYLAQENPDPKVVSERIPVLEHWLAFFQEAGTQVVEQLKQKLATSETTDTAVNSEVESLSREMPPEAVAEEETVPQQDQEEMKAEPISVQVEERPKSESLWTIEKIKKQTEMTKDLQAWVAARCVTLGNKEVFAYPYYGLVVDMMRQTRGDIQKILEDEKMLREVNETYPGEVRNLQDYQVSLDKDLEVAAQNGISDETALISDELTGEDAKRVLGQLDTSNTPEFSGPAPDGFEVILDTDTELDDQQIKEEYNQIENAVLSEQSENKNEKKTSQTQQNSVKKKLSFSLGNKKPAGT